MNVLVTGGAGFIGSHTVDRLLAQGHGVRILDNLDPQVHGDGAWPDYLAPGAERRNGDVRNPEHVASALEGMDAVLFLAAAVGVGQSMYDIRRYVDVNSMGAATLLEALTTGSHSIGRLVVASSMSCYGEGAYRCARCGPRSPRLRPVVQLRARSWEPLCGECAGPLEPVPTPESKPLAPTSVYAVTKRDHEELFLTVGDAYGIPTVAMRFFNVYGPRQSLSNPYTGVLAIFSSRMLNGEAPVIFEDGRQSRDFIHVRDVARANVLALESGSAGEVFNVGTGSSTSVLDLTRRLARVIGFDEEPRIDERFRAGDIRHCYADTTKAREILGFHAEIGLDEGLADTAGWLMGQTAEDRVARATEELEGRGLLR